MSCAACSLGLAHTTCREAFPFMAERKGRTSMVTVFLLLGLSAFLSTLLAALGKCPLWLPVLLIAIIELWRCLPLGK